MLSSLLTVLLATLASALPTATVGAQATPLPPSQDPWYTAPNGYENAMVGEILRIRPAPGNLTTIFSNSSAAYDILYRTTSTHFEPFWAVTTLFVPQDTNTSTLLSYQVPYNSADVDGSISYGLYAAAAPANAIVYSDIQNALGKGWYVNVPDYNGPLTSFGEGLFEGMATLDSIRAVKHAEKALSDDARIALWGYSGGTIASENAAELQSTYAPDLNIVGAALGGTVANLSSVIPAVTGTRWAGLLPEVTLGLFSQYPEAMTYLHNHLKEAGPHNATEFLAAQNMSIAEAFAYYNGSDIFNYFTNGAAFYQAPLVQYILKRETYMGFRGIPLMPLFFYHAVHDEITHISNPQALVKRYCSAGADVLFERNTVGGHVAEETNGDARAMAWLEKVLSGDMVGEGCVVKDVTLDVTDSPL